MSTTTQKHSKFVSEPMAGKPVTALPGIGASSGRHLEAQGFDKADKVLGKFLVMGKEERPFTNWMKTVDGVSDRRADACYDGLKEWSKNNL